MTEEQRAEDADRRLRGEYCGICAHTVVQRLTLPQLRRDGITKGVYELRCTVCGSSDFACARDGWCPCFQERR